jgi:tetratricopeptide (TPR) repeat protein
MSDDALHVALDLAKSLLVQGRLSEARDAYLQILERRPHDALVMSMLAAVSLRFNDMVGALRWLDRALEIAPDGAGLHVNRGIVLMRLNEPGRALDSFDRAIAIDPGVSASAFYHRACALSQLNRLEAAIASFDEVITRTANLDANAYHGRGTALLRSGRAADAAESFGRAIALGTTFSVEARMSCGLAFVALKSYEAALERFEEALAADPSNAMAHKCRGSMLYQLGRYDPARASLERAVELRPLDAGAHNLLGMVCAQLGSLEASLANFDTAIAIDVRLDGANANKSGVLAQMGRLEEALASIDREIELVRNAVSPDARDAASPDLARLLFARANLLLSVGDRAGAIGGFRAALELDSRSAAARMAIAVAQIPALAATMEEEAESAARFEAELIELENWLQSNRWSDPDASIGLTLPFYLAYQNRNLRSALARHGRLCTEAMADWQRSRGMSAPGPAVRDGRLRIGIVCAKVSDHSVYNAIIRGWLRCLDRSRIAIDLFHVGSQVDARTQEARELADNLVQGPLRIHDWAGRILERRPNVLIYPEIGMDRVTFQLACLRLADVQIASWGHPVTTGLPSIDFFLSAQAFEPPNAQQHYSERLVSLSGLGVCYEPEPPAPGQPAARHDLSGHGPVLICAGTPFKYAPEHDAVLIEIARRLGPCRFVFFQHLDGAVTRRLLARLRSAFHSAGLSPEEHLVVKPWMSAAEFHAFMGTAHVFLDTIGFSGFNTVMQALASGLPVVAHRGSYMRGRLGSGVLEFLTASPLIADSESSYVEKVVALAVDPLERARWTEHFARELPRAYGDRSAVEELQSFLLSL